MVSRFMAVALLAFGTLAARADVVFSDFAPSDGYNQSNAYAAAGSTSPIGTYITAAAFTSSSTVDLSQIDLALWNYAGTNSVEISLLSDNSDTPGSVIESWDVSNLPNLVTVQGYPSGNLTTVTPTSTVELDSGTQYWVEIQAIDPSTEDLWYENDLPGSNPEFPTATAGTVATNGGSGFSVSTTILPAFDVLGTPVSSVPEPNSVPLLAIGVAALLWKLRRRSAG